MALVLKTCQLCLTPHSLFESRHHLASQKLCLPSLHTKNFLYMICNPSTHIFSFSIFLFISLFLDWNQYFTNLLQFLLLFQSISKSDPDCSSFSSVPWSSVYVCVSGAWQQGQWLRSPEYKYFSTEALLYGETPTDSHAENRKRAKDVWKLTRSLWAETWQQLTLPSN